MALALLLLFFWQSADPNAEGMKSLEAKDYQAALTHFQKVVEQDPEDYGAHFHLALANSLLQRREPAIAGYRKVLQLKPGLYEAELNLGILLLDAKQTAESVTPNEDFTKWRITVRPGITRTAMTEGVSAKYDRLIEGGLVPAKRWGEASDVGAAVAGLASGKFAFATGSVVNVDGGLSVPKL